MVATWIESAAKGRHGGPVRAGMWSAVVVGTHPIEANQSVWIEVVADDLALTPLPAYWIENKGVNSLWHVPIPPQAVGVRLHYRSAAHREGADVVYSPYQDTIVRPNLPERTATSEVISEGPEGLVGNNLMTARVDSRGSTYDVYFPTVGLHSDVRPAEGELPQSRSHFRAIVGGLALERRLDWFNERNSWHAFQHYLGATNLLVTELNWRNGPIKVLVTDLVVKGGSLPRTSGGTDSPGQYIKRFRFKNEGSEPRRALFGVFVHAEVNGGIGEPGLSWHDGDRTLLAMNRGHGHANRKLARDATVEFALAFDGRGDVHCEPTGANEAILFRWLDLPAGESVVVDLIVSGAFTGWRGDPGTFEHWLRPALAWFRSADIDLVEQATAQEWDAYVEPLPNLHFPKPSHGVSLRRSALAAALHADAQWGAIASGFDRGLSAYCWPRDALWVAGTFERLGHPLLSKGVLQWLARVRGKGRPYTYWFQKYTIDGGPEWETPAVDQTAMVPLCLERYYRRTGDLEFVVASWPMLEQAAAVCAGQSGHPGLAWIDDLRLVSSGGLWNIRYGAFLYSNACIVAGLRGAARLATALEKPEHAERWLALADRIWEGGILRESTPGGRGPGLVDAESGRFLDARRLSTMRGLWTDDPEYLIDRSAALDISLLGVAVPFALLPASDPRMVRTAEAILRHSTVGGDPNLLMAWSLEASSSRRSSVQVEKQEQEVSSLATLWMARYLIQLGRETGQGRHWNRALAMLEGILGRLLPLGLALRSTVRNGGDSGRSLPGITASVWGLHAMLIEAMLDLGGLGYDAVDRQLSLEPALPSTWPHVGLSQTFPCGEAAYRLDRPIGGTVHQLHLRVKLDHPVTLRAGITCPGLNALGEWQSEPSTPPPEFDRSACRLTWSLDLPAGESAWRWTWG